MIQIKKSETADTRTCDFSKVSKEALIKSTISHKGDVVKGIDFLIQKLNEIKINHDHTKLSFIDEFYRDFQNGFKTQDWYKKHQEIERHHLSNTEYIHEDVNLLDVLEQVVDAVMAAKARNGVYKQMPLPKGLLEKAYNNTVGLLLDEVEVIE